MFNIIKKLFRKKREPQRQFPKFDEDGYMSIFKDFDARETFKTNTIIHHFTHEDFQCKLYMTDEEIIALSEKTKKEKYCTQNTVCVCEKPAIYDCDSECPISYCDDCNTLCGDTIYEQGFLDGFRAGVKMGQDMMSDYVMELQHAAYND